MLKLISTRTNDVLGTGNTEHNVIKNTAREYYHEEIERAKYDNNTPESYISITKYLLIMMLKGRLEIIA